MQILAIDIGGTHVKILASGQTTPRKKFISGPTLSAAEMVPRVQELAADWQYDHISIGYPGPVLHDKPITEPHNLAPGLGRLRFRRGFQSPGADHQRRRHAGRWAATKGGGCCSSGWEPAWDRRWSSTGCWNRWSWPGLRLSQADVRGLRQLQAGKIRQGSLAGPRGRRGPDAVHGTRARLRRARRRQREEIESPAAEMPGRRDANAFLGGFRLWEQTATLAAANPRPARQQPFPRRTRLR